MPNTLRAYLYLELLVDQRGHQATSAHTQSSRSSHLGCVFFWVPNLPKQPESKLYSSQIYLLDRGGGGGGGEREGVTKSRSNSLPVRSSRLLVLQLASQLSTHACAECHPQTLGRPKHKATAVRFSHVGRGRMPVLVVSGRLEREDWLCIGERISVRTRYWS
jgi:hypothetical protein